MCSLFTFGFIFAGFSDIFYRFAIFLGWVILEVAIEIVGVKIEIFVDLIDIIRVVVDVLSSLEIKLWQKESFVSLEVEVRNQICLTIYLGCCCAHEVLLH